MAYLFSGLWIGSIGGGRGARDAIDKEKTVFCDGENINSICKYIKFLKMKITKIWKKCVNFSKNFHGTKYKKIFKFNLNFLLFFKNFCNIKIF